MSPGVVIDHYRVISRLGAGGMGEVWLAEDLRLGRHVALKILPADVPGGNEGLHRLLHEGRAAAALNHPNIAQIHEIGEFDGKGYLAMEYVEGKSLRDLISAKPMPVEQVIEIALQIADALEEAHSKGIVHRDIKPGNVMINPRGQAKVLDFGLAKMEKPRKGETSSDAPTEPMTSPGQVMGTLEYMSPEQCLGEEVDARSDIFSLGTVLYEMLTGRRPFTGSSSAAIYDGILNRQPPPPSSLNPQDGPLLDPLVARAMEKDRALRYQTVADLRADLRRLKRDVSTSSQPVATLPAAEGSRIPRWLWIALPLLLAAIFLVVRLARRQPPTRIYRADPFTSTAGSETQPAFSPDGARVAFAWNRDTENNWDIYVTVLDAGTPLRITQNPATDHSPAWSPDGRFLLFLRQSDSENSAFLLVPSLGGAEQKLVDASPERTGVDAPYAAWMPDGKQVLIANKRKSGEPMGLYRVDVQSGAQEQITRPPEGTYGDSCVVIRPDGKMIYFVRTQSLGVQDIFELSVAGGEPRRLTFDNRRIFGMAWDPVDSLLLFSSARGGPSRIWRLVPQSRKLSNVMGIGEMASFLSVNGDGKMLAYTRSMLDTNVWRYPLPGNRNPDAAPTPLLHSTRLEQGPRYSPDGSKIVFSSNRTGSAEIWVCDAEGADCTQLTHLGQPGTGSPFWSPDGKQIAFDSRPDGNPDIYLISPQGGTVKRLTTDSSEEIVPSWSRDGKWIYFGSNRSGSYQIYRVPAAGGEPAQITRQGGFHGVESPDGQYLYYTRALSEGGLYRRRLPDGEEEAILKELPAGFWAYWAMTADRIYYVFREEVNGAGVRYSLRGFDLRTRRHSIVMPLANRPFNAGLSLSPDGQWCLYTQVDRSDTDIMMVRDFH